MGVLGVVSGHLAFDVNAVKHTNVIYFISPFSSIFILKDFSVNSSFSVFQRICLNAEGILLFSPPKIVGAIADFQS